MALQYRQAHPEIRLWYDARRRALENNLDFDITVEDVVVPPTCPVLGIPIFVSGKCNNVPQPNSPSLDRIDNGHGYVRGNVRVISWRANKLKGEMTLEEACSLVQYMRKAS